jgi:hypothetical protein
MRSHRPSLRCPEFVKPGSQPRTVALGGSEHSFRRILIKLQWAHFLEVSGLEGIPAGARPFSPCVKRGHGKSKTVQTRKRLRIAGATRKQNRSKEASRKRQVLQARQPAELIAPPPLRGPAMRRTNIAPGQSGNRGTRCIHERLNIGEQITDGCMMIRVRARKAIPLEP